MGKAQSFLVPSSEILITMFFTVISTLLGIFSSIHKKSNNSKASVAGFELIISVVSLALVIDPQTSRQDVMWSQVPQDQQEQTFFANRLGAFQTLIRLKILAELTLRLCHGIALKDLDEVMLLECFRVLPQQPSLSEHLLVQVLSMGENVRSD